MDVTSGFQVNVTVVSNDFIDRYMASANGEYIKVYLFVLRHQHEPLNLEWIADSLNHTEADVKRALTYWEKLGALHVGSLQQEEEPLAALAGKAARGAVSGGLAGAMPGVGRQAQARVAKEAAYRETSASSAAGQKPVTVAAPSAAKAPAVREEAGAGRKAYSQEQVNALASDEDFTQLLYIAQKYLNKVFTPRECEVFAYLYDGLHMPVELLEYLTEYCAQNGHTSIRYLETVALSWHEKGFRTVEQAKGYAAGFTRDSFAVMKAFGLSERRPGDAELELIERWFQVYGFTREVVLEACNRTLSSIHSPSFRYADKILMQWKNAGVKSLQDVALLDQKRQAKPAKAQGRGKPANQFHNFEQRETDYDSMVLDQVKSWIGTE